MKYPKIETAFRRDPVTFKLIPGAWRNPAFALINKWQWSEKIDGTNIRLCYTPGEPAIDIKGRTDNAQLHTRLLSRIYFLINIKKFAEVFGECSAVVFGEGYGPVIHNGDRYSDTEQFAGFDVLVMTPGGNKYWLSPLETSETLNELGLPEAPFLMIGTIDDAVKMVSQGFASRLSARAQAEGLVGRPSVSLFDSRQNRLIVKLKTKDFHTNARDQTTAV